MERDNFEDITLIEFVRALFVEWRIVVGVTAAFAVLSVVVALVLDEVYRAEVAVTETGKKSAAATTSSMLAQFGGLASLAGVDVGALGGNESNVRAILHSRTLVEEFIIRHELLPVLHPDAWDAESQEWRTAPEDTPTVWRATKNFKEANLHISEEVATGVIRVAVEWGDPELAAKWANDIVALANELVRQNDLAEARRNMEFLDLQIRETGVVEMQRMLYGLLESEMQTVMLAEAQSEYAFKVIDRAVVPEVRTFPRRTLLVVLGTILGGFIATLAVLVKCIIRKPV